MSISVIRDTFIILIITSFAEGDSASEKKRKLIMGFLEDNFDGSFDPDEEVEKLNLLTDDGYIKEFRSAAKRLDSVLDITDKTVVLDFMSQIIFIDENLNEMEGYLLKMLSEIWGINLEKYFDKYK
ncbi:MAG: hypothetical protein ACQEQF_05865 [Bacillota bacterium]